VTGAAALPAGPHMATSARYLLVASMPASGGRAQPRLDLFSDLAEAKAAFRAVRVQTNPRADWAHLVSIDAGGGLRPVCWFGTPSPSLGRGGGPLPSRESELTGVKPAVRRRRTWPRVTPPVVNLQVRRAERATHPSVGGRAS